ncbi:fatty acyl-CoA hydrolase precursor, medium chain-like [Rhinophrynus dorsalis]
MVYGWQNEAQPLISTTYGQLLGKRVEVEGTERAVHTFLGIPFAKPPIGPLRFSNPQPPEKWNSVRDATKAPPMCLQDEAAIKQLFEYFKTDLELPPISEDCLYLNVFTPADRNQDSKLPVMVFIHGGGLAIGGASMIDGSALSASENAVIVAIQYRLGILGFFSTDDKQAQGNYGFFDQVASLQWVQGNIQDFGGDPESVTIFGESAGGVSVSVLVLSPLSKGLFHRAISESGVAILPELMSAAPETLLMLRNLITNISGCDSSTLVSCLKEKSEEEIFAIAAAMKFTPFPGTVDGVLLPKPAEEIMADNESNRVPYLIGVNQQEFRWLIPMTLNLKGLTEGMDKETVQSTLHVLPLLGKKSRFLPLIMDEYFGDTNDSVEIRNRFLELCGDLLFVIPALRTANYHRDSGNPVYFYEFQHRPSFFNESKPAFVKADHGDELYFVTGGPFLRSDIIFKGKATDEEKVLSKRMMKYWANFARKGDPNGPGLAEWPEYDEDEDYLEINLKQKSAKKLKAHRLKFWTSLPERYWKKRQLSRAADLSGF